jgi:hypothetical protein
VNLLWSSRASLADHTPASRWASNNQDLHPGPFTGDWYNSIDWTGETHKLGIGLPVSSDRRNLLHKCSTLLVSSLLIMLLALV